MITQYQKQLLILAIALFIVMCPIHTLAIVQPEIDQGIDEIIGGLDLSRWETLLQNIPEGIQSIWGHSDISQLIEHFASGEAVVSEETVAKSIQLISQTLLPQLGKTLLPILAIAILSGFIKALSEGDQARINDVAGFVCHCFAAMVALAVFASFVRIAGNAIDETTKLIELLFPVLLTLLTAAGGMASAGIFQPAMAGLVGGVSVILKTLVLPTILAAGTLTAVDHITTRVQLGKLYGLCKSALKWVIGLIATLYFGVISLQGLTAASFDGISVRTAKYALDKLIPIVGGVVSGSVDTILGCAVLVKNAAGVVAILLTFGMVCMPLLEIGVGILSFRLAAALCEPVSEERLPKMFGALGDVLTYLFAAVASLGLMFVITVGLMIHTGTMVI